ncbi:hypothetical protein C1646_774403 [Rhizophagus diaphanus]|nr:hypothetical protein C1646_774403 [Rhizophagus diaphanus] [Rhizophagus sp. MUCL 43196]
MNPTKFTKIESYVQFLLNKLKNSSTKEEFAEELRCNNGNFLEIDLLPNNENLKDNFKITSEIYKKIEIFCNIFKIRSKGQTIKNQTNTKIVDYSEQKIKLTTLTITLRSAKRIDRLLSLSNNNFLIVDIFPNLDVAFFKSSSINVAAYKC